MLDTHKLGRRAIVVIERRPFPAEVGIESGERIVHRHCPAHDLLLVVPNGCNHRVGAEEDGANQIILDLRRILELVHEQVRVGQSKRVSRHRIDPQQEFGEPPNHWERKEAFLALVERRLPVAIRRPLAGRRIWRAAQWERQPHQMTALKAFTAIAWMSA